MKNIVMRSIALSLSVVVALGVALGVAPVFADTEAPVPPDTAQSAARKACTDAMNADKKFAEQIVAVADENAAHRREEATVQAHQEAQDHIIKNEKHVVYAYAAMWIVAALFVLFLWRRQLRLSAEIVQLRRDLAAASTSTDPEPVPAK